MDDYQYSVHLNPASLCLVCVIFEAALRNYVPIRSFSALQIALAKSMLTALSTKEYASATALVLPLSQEAVEAGKRPFSSPTQWHFWRSSSC